jgi:ribosomal protein S18 acetylase RimI-like enzyme
VLVDDHNRSWIDSGVRVVRATPSHLNTIVEIHLQAFAGFFLKSLGPSFLKELYRGFISEPSGVCLVAVDGKTVVGFVAGTTQPEKFFLRLLRRRWYAFLLAGTASFARHPLRVGAKFLSALRYRGEKPVDVPNAALLSSIGVFRSGKGQGIGKILIAAFCQKAQNSGASTVFLTTDRDNNDAVNEFYLSSGFTLHSSFLKERKRWMKLYVRNLSDMQPTSQLSSLSKTRGREDF